MRLALNRDSFANALAKVRKVIPSSSTLAVLECVYLQAEDGKVILTGSNLEQSLRVPVTGAASVIVPGSTCIPARLLADTLAVFKDVTVDIELTPSGDTVRLYGVGSDFRIKTIPWEEYPMQVIANGAENCQIPAGVIKKLISGGANAAGKDQSRPVLTGALLELGDKQANMTSADGFRLAHIEHDLPETLGLMEVIVPMPALYKLLDVLNGLDDAKRIQIGFHWRHRQDLFNHKKPAEMALQSMIVSWDDTVFTTTVLDGKWPDYRQIIPKAWRSRFVVDRMKFRDAIVKAWAYVPDRVMSLILMQVQYDEHERPSLVAYSKNAVYGYGEGVTSLMKAEGITERFRYGINAKYLADALASISTETVEVQFSGNEDQPLTILPVDGPAGIAQKIVVMPMNIKGVMIQRETVEEMLAAPSPEVEEVVEEVAE